MKVNFQFNDTVKVVITPETPREIQLTRLAFLNERIRPEIDYEISENAKITLLLSSPNNENSKLSKDSIQS